MAKRQKAKSDSEQTPSAVSDVARMALNWSIAGLSIAVLIGFAYWAISLGTRDPNEVPIIRAMEGPARITPNDPGGQQALHQGLAVNKVQSEGGVEKPANQVVLAPPPESLQQEDMAGANLAMRVEPKQPAVMAPAEEPDVVARVEPDVTAPEVVAPPAPVISGTRFSPKSTMRPPNRPSDLAKQLAEVQPAVARPSTAAFVDSVPLGTRLVQLGAYDSTDLAVREWDKLFAKHSDLLEGKKRLVQAAESGGRRFFRLRAVGFASKDESRTLCSALLARGTPCIPVTAR